MWFVVQAFYYRNPLFMVYSLLLDGNRLLITIKNTKMSIDQKGTQYSGSLSEKPEGLHLYCLCENSKPFWSEDTILVRQG